MTEFEMGVMAGWVAGIVTADDEPVFPLKVGDPL